MEGTGADRHGSGAGRHLPNSRQELLGIRREAADAQLAGVRRNWRQRPFGWYVEDAKKRGPVASPAASQLVGKHANRDQILRLEQPCGVFARQVLAALDFGREILDRRAHLMVHPLPMLAHSSSARRPAVSVVRMRFGHCRVNPSDAHFRVASMPIFPP